jgi:predicted molibdopterin-dependent oxidoreductase YjgC
MEARIKEHPILGEVKKGRLVKFTHDGQVLEGYEGEPIAVALKAAGVLVHRYTEKKHSPRGVFCAIGRCTDCVMIVNGEPNIRTCVTPLKEGMTVDTQYGTSDEPFVKELKEAK